MATSRPGELSIFVGTFNLGNAPPDAEWRRSFLAKARNADLVVVGAQEAHYVPPAQTTSDSDSRTARLLKVTGAVGGALAGGALLSAALPLALVGAAVGAAAGVFGGHVAAEEVGCRLHFFGSVQEALGEQDFTCLSAESLLQLRLCVFVRRSRFGLPPPSGSSSLSSALRGTPLGASTFPVDAAAAKRFQLHGWSHECGVLPGVATKGGLGVSLCLPPAAGLGGVTGGGWSRGGVRLAFVAAHLAAHAGEPRCTLRNRQLRETLCALAGRSGAAAAAAEEAERGGWGGSDSGGCRLLEQLHDHVFVCGDLNYRVDGAAVAAAEGGGGARDERGWEATVRCAASERFELLLEADELAKERKAGRCPLGFGYKEAPITFPPTFKLQSGGLGGAGKRGYAQKRVPSYTDRILWWSYAGGGDAMRVLEYSACREVQSSDHVPVSGVFALRMP